MQAGTATVERAVSLSHPSATGGVVDVWRARLDVPEMLDEATRVLSDDEIARARRFRRSVDGRRYVAARFALRRILASRLGMEPREVRFIYGSHGKPLVLPRRGRPLCFSVAHSADVALYAVAHDRQVGVDLELMRPEVSVLDIARRFFAPDEVRTLCATTPDRRAEMFYRCWTRKEAYLKAKGLGLSAPLDAFAIALDAVGSAALLWNQLEPRDVGRWSFIDLNVASGYAAALVVEGAPPVTEGWVWN